MRIALGIEYDGTAFSGWESQPRQRTVQQEVERALSIVADRPVRVVCAGRTDAGVHAWEQVVHFETDAERPDKAWVMGSNTRLPKDVCIHWSARVADAFHARFSARQRCYRYLIYNHPVRSANLHRRSTWECRPLDAALMHAEAQYLVGEHDFTSYRAAGCQSRSPVRHVHRMDVRRHGRLIVIEAVANAFLQHMVRNIAGVLVAVGSGRQPPGWAQQVLAQRDRRCGGVTAPPNGLTLVSVAYPPEFRLPRVLPPAPLW